MPRFELSESERDLLTTLCYSFIDLMTGDELAVRRALAEMTDRDIDVLVALSERLDPEQFPDPPTMKLNW